MAYATRADIEALYGTATLDVVAGKPSPAETTAAILAALRRASDEIDLHVGAVLSLPLAVVPAQLVQLCVDIALYRLALDAGVRTDEHRTRYEDAVGLLKRIAEGKARLTLPPDPEADPEDPFTQRPQPVVTVGPERLFSRDRMRGL